MKDVQSEKDLRHIPLKHVGIKNLRWPIELMDKERGTQHSVANVTLAVDLPHDLRGTHMSRFVECLRTLGPVGLNEIENILDKLKEHLQAEKAFMQLEFPYFITKAAPVSGMTAPMDMDCVYKAEKGERFKLRITAVVPVQTLCPCSKEISDYGAHNQRAWAKMEIEASELVWLEELAALADAAASAPVYGLLKRPDEKFVTERAYDNPRFVEDAVREIALRLEADKRITWYRAEVESVESIHNHNAFAVVEKGE
ncbi:MAG: GTP cyclohydrolase FolE2 [Phascolarctobacterium sp.]|uniref:GTP cyclohydrolase FolE2 n=1 Tax=Phascolarctobacterium sp. TaxID=2049039 RepID=UPI0026DAD3B4|nr:GTP cyclohydrolase FolE2 [Phascolarctobacterium sp.]MDO4921282.1 GTP cyclohydrolase FolE2 [Phascolarctobacterium sp.]